MSDVLVMREVVRCYGSGEARVAALRGVSLSVRRGELVAVMGPSGSGKSTMLLVAGGLERPDAGEVTVNGVDLVRAGPTQVAAVRRRSVGYVFQDFNLVSALTAVENVALPLELDGMRPAVARGIAMEGLAEVGLADVADRFPDDISGGQRQRVSIARAVVGQRELILADEPTGALDTETGDTVLRLLRDRVDTGVAALLVTHDARHAAWADRIVYVRDGLITRDRGAVESGQGWAR